MDPEVDAEDKNAAKDYAAPVKDDCIRLQMPVLQVCGKEQGGAKDGQAADRGDGGGEVELPPLEPDQQAGEGEGGNCKTISTQSIRGASIL